MLQWNVLCSFSVLFWLLFLVALLQARPAVLKQLNCIAELLHEAGQVHPGEGGSLQQDTAVLSEGKIFLAYSSNK